MKRVRINVRTLVNSAAIRTETRNGREVIVVPSATLPDNVVMNGIRYPAKAIEASFKSLERTLAPLGHPKAADGGFLNAKDPEAINRHHIGAWNENVRREGGRVLLDKVIDVQAANACEGGKRVLAAIKAGKPIHTSTGLLATLNELNGDPEAKAEIAEMTFDHDAILLDEPGAATPEQGVGMLVNGQQVEVINSDLDEVTERQIDYAVEEITRALDRKRRAPMLDKIKETILSILGAGDGATETEESPMQNEEAEMPMTDEEAAALKDGLAAMQTKITELTDAMSAIAKRFAAEDAAKAEAAAAEKTDMEEKVVEAGMMNAEEAKDAPVEALRVLVNQIKPAAAAPILGRFNAAGGNTVADLAAHFPKEA